MSFLSRGLERIGLSNRFADFPETHLVSKPTNLIAYCNSISCTTKQYPVQTLGTRKEVPISTIDCPDCRSAIFWKRSLV